MNLKSTDGRKYDVVIFGATAFTGQYVVREMLFNSKYKSWVKWAIAGRNVNKLTCVLEEQKKFLEESRLVPIPNSFFVRLHQWYFVDEIRPISTKYSEGTSFSTVEVGLITANVDDYQSLLEMARCTKMLINMVGPYKIYGRDVVKSCVENGTHHLDISGEPSFLEEIQLKYNDMAHANNCYVVGSLGFGSVIADLGLAYCKLNFHGKLLAAESYAYMAGNEQSKRPYLNTGTWYSFINSIKSEKQTEFQDNRHKLHLGRPKLKGETILLKKKNIHKSIRNRYAVPFIGSDKTVVEQTIFYNHKQTGEDIIQYMPYIEYSHLIVYPRFFSIGVFSEKGPSEKSIANTYAKMHFKLYGSSDGSNNVDTIKHAVISGPNVYTGTARLIVAAVFTILEENVKDIKGGVLTPAVALSNSSYIDRVEKRGFTFSLVE
ncbi:hypothetical protein A3Q56_04392 [Intoshia linei]|uniref:Saccharopine dehydrogenase NADP binding domain-containing protein n=1 Tax=Intoshia linei TaxID=1819745 RepID=A0A177B0Z9_9BILA|nr:hypothetical protein A3Q56_04392 [Intoshia linei]